MLATVARDSMIALYAADSGIECGAMNYFAENKVASTSVNPIQCNDNGGTGIALRLTHSTKLTGNNSATTTFYMPIRIDGGSDVGLACVAVNVGYNVDNSGNRTVDIIEARGYNVGWNPAPSTPGGTPDCSLQTARKVERGLRLMYK
jgi:hypothetical protein